MNLAPYVHVSVGLLKKHIHDYPDFKFRHFSFITDSKGKVLGVGANGPCDAAKRYGFKLGTLHSELRAFFSVPKRLKSTIHTCINIRLGNGMQPRLAAPCLLCQSFLKANGIRRVFATPNVEVRL